MGSLRLENNVKRALDPHMPVRRNMGYALKLAKLSRAQIDATLRVEMRAEIARLAAAHADVPVVLSHFAFPFDRSAEGIAARRDGLGAVAGLAHVHLKASGLRMLEPDMPDALVADLLVEAAEVWASGG